MTIETELGQMVCYVLMRTDMLSLNPGKACAQAHHAGTLMLRHSVGWEQQHQDWLLAWMNQGDGFGTVVCLGAKAEDIKHAYGKAGDLMMPRGVVTDPSYPLKDGDVIHHLPLSTCAYIFGPKPLAELAVTRLRLHP